MQKFKRDKIDICNICLQKRVLTWDHIPPKGGIKLTPMEINDVYKFLTEKSPKHIISQNGVKYRFICKECNSKLGQRFDYVLNEFAISTGKIIKSKIYRPTVIKIRTKPKAIIKSILGHILAAKSKIDNSLIDTKIREYLFDESIKLDEYINIFYWIYPYDAVVILRDFAMSAKRNLNLKDAGFFQIIKYFPIAYLITNLKEYEGLPELTKYRNLKSDEEIDLPIFLNRVEDPDWPERVDKFNIILATQETEKGILAKPKKPNQS